MLSQLMMLFGFFALILVGVYWVNRAVTLFEHLISDGQSAWVFLEFTALALPTVIRLMLPMAAVVAVIFVTNRLSTESELSVMQATGFSPWRLARPVLWFGIIVALMVGALSNVLEPAARAQLSDRRGEIAANIASQFLIEGTFVHPAPGITFYIREITPGNELRDAFLSDRTSPDRQTIYTAESAALVRSEDGPKLVMFDGMAQTHDRRDGRLSTTRFSDFAYDVGALIEGPAARTRSPDEMTTDALFRLDAGAMAASGVRQADVLLEINERIAQPLTSIAAGLIAFATLLSGGFSRFGLWRQVGLAVALLVLVQFAANLGSKLALQNAAAWPAVHLAPLLGFAIAGLILQLAARPRRVRPTIAGVPA
jgi:lipopolysaccharide export system permease protein